MGLDPALSFFPRDFKKIPIGTEYGTGSDEGMNKAVEARRLAYLEEDLYAVLKDAVATKERPMFTTALIAGDAVILDALHKTGLLSKVPIVFVDTFTLFPETLQYLHEVRYIISISVYVTIILRTTRQRETSFLTIVQCSMMYDSVAMW